MGLNVRFICKTLDPFYAEQILAALQLGLYAKERALQRSKQYVFSRRKTLIDMEDEMRTHNIHLQRCNRRMGRRYFSW